MKSFFHTDVPYISQFFLLSISSLDVEDLYLLNEVYDTSLWCGPLKRQTFQTSLNSLSFPTKKRKNINTILKKLLKGKSEELLWPVI